MVVRNHRIVAGITQEVLAEKAGLHATFVGMVERGIRNPTLDVAERISMALKIEFPVLLREALHERGGRGKRS